MLKIGPLFVYIFVYSVVLKFGLLTEEASENQYTGKIIPLLLSRRVD